MKKNNLKKAQVSVSMLPLTIIVIFVVVLVAFFLIKNNPADFFKFLPIFNSSEDMDANTREAREMLKSVEENPAIINTYNCRVVEKGFCLDGRDDRMLRAGKPLDRLEECSLGDYCYHNQGGCVRDVSYPLKDCYEFVGEEDFRLPEVCEEGVIEGDCVCLDDKGNKTIFSSEFSEKYLEDELYNQLLGEYSITRTPFSEFLKKNLDLSNLKSKEIDFLLENIQICTRGEICDFGGKGCFYETDINMGVIYNRIKKFENFREYAYLDTSNKCSSIRESGKCMTIGYGFNLDKPGAVERISELDNEYEGVNLDFNKIYHGFQKITPEQAEYLMKKDVEIAIGDAKKYISEENWEDLPASVKYVLIDMAYNLGYPSLSKFQSFREELLKPNYSAAADEMVDSEWYSQVRTRAEILVSEMRSLA